MFTRFDANKSTKGASKLRRDLINAEIANLRDLLPLPPSTRQRLSQLQLMALVCVYVRKTNYFQQAFKCHNVNLQSTTPSIGFSKALNGFLMMMTQNGKLLYISDNAAEYLGHSMEDLLIHGDSVYDIIDKQDHPVIQAEMARSAGSEDEARMFMCRINVTRNARRQMRFGDQKVVLVQGHYLSFLPLCSRNEPVFIATCTPIAMPETRECVVQGATNVFTSIHSMDMKFMYLDRIGEYHLGFLWVELQGVSWYKLLHWECMQEAQAKHRLITQSDQDRACILLVRLQRRVGDWIWIHCVLQVKDSVENNQHPVIVCTNQILSDREAIVMRSNGWLYEYYMVQSKLQYGLTYAGSQGNISRTTPYYHHHSPQPPGHPSMHHIHQSDNQVSTPPGLGHSIVQPTPEHLPLVEIRPTTSVRQNVEKIEPVDYSLPQPSTQYHVCPPIGRCFSSSSTGEDSLDTFSRQVDDSYVHQYRSVVTVTQCNAHSYSSDSPDVYSYHLLGADHQNVPETSTFGSYTSKYLEVADHDQRKPEDDLPNIPRYRGKCKKSSTESISSVMTAPPSDREQFQEDDDVFTNQWKLPIQQRMSPTTDNLEYHHKTHELKDTERNIAIYHSPTNQNEDEVTTLGFQQKRKLIMPLTKCEYREPKSPRYDSGTGSILTEWTEPNNLQPPSLYNYDAVRPSIVYANKESLCYWKHLETYAKTHLNVAAEKYTMCNIDRPKSRDSFNDICNESRYHYNHHWTTDQWIYPLHPPLPATIDTSPLSTFSSSSYSDLSPVSTNNVMHYILPPDAYPKTALVDEVIF